MFIQETLRAVDGVLGPDPLRWLSSDVALHSGTRGRIATGSDEVGRMLRALFWEQRLDDVRLTLDEGRAVVECTSPTRDRPFACSLDIEHSLVTGARLYGWHDSTSAPPTVRLTRRELTVAQLVTAGMSNREIADELVVSVRTVEYHLRNVFMKLGISRRTQIAQRLRAEP